MTTISQDKVTSHWNFRANSYRFNLNKDFFNRDVAAKWQLLLEEALGTEKPLKALDAGCGPAVLTRLLLGLGHEVTGVDVSEKMVEMAREAVGEDHPRARFQQGNVSELPFEDGSFDLIISRYVVWTLPDPVKAVKEWQRLLKPGGRIGIIDGNWYYHYYRSPFNRMWSKANNLIYRIRSGFDPGQKLATNYAADLPSTKVLRPHWDLGLLAGMGFDNITTYQRIEQRIWGRWSLNQIKNPWNHQFLIMATKPAD